MSSTDEETYQKAVAIVREEGCGREVVLQRRLNIGWGQAHRILNRMEADRIVGPRAGPLALLRPLIK